jgi:hypothetical protein
LLPGAQNPLHGSFLLVSCVHGILPEEELSFVVECVLHLSLLGMQKLLHGSPFLVAWEHFLLPDDSLTSAMGEVSPASSDT